MASEAPVPAAGISSLFKKKKGKKTRGSNLNNDSGIQKTEEKPKIEKLQEILGGPDPAEDDGWADVVEKKSVVATGGKQVSDLINMTALMTEDESTAAKLEKQDIKQAFHDARTLKEAAKKEEAPEPAKEEEVKEEEATKPKGLSGDIFGGAARSGGLAGGWRKRMEERELKQRQEELSVDNASAFPSLKDAMSAPAKPKQSAPDPDANRWVRRAGGGSAAAAAIKAALGREEEEEKKAAPASEADAPPPPAADGGADAAEPAAPGASPPAAAAASAEEAKVAEPTWVAPSQSGGGAGAAAGEGGAEVAAEAAPVAVEEEKEPAAAETDKGALVQQFGKKKKKKKKPAEEEGAGGEP